jgi:hypothetical protein
MRVPKRFPDRAIVRFPPGMLDRVAAVLKPGEDWSRFILAAVAAALRKAERDKPSRGDVPKLLDVGKLER